MAIAGAAGHPPTHPPLLSAWRCGCRRDEELPGRMPRRTRAALSPADRRCQLPEMTCRIICVAAGVRVRVSECQLCMRFYVAAPQSCQGRETWPYVSRSMHKSPMRLIQQQFNKRDITILARVRTPRTAGCDAHSHPDHGAHRSPKIRKQNRHGKQKLISPASRARRGGIKKVQDDHLRPKRRRVVWGRRRC